MDKLSESFKKAQLDETTNVTGGIFGLGSIFGWLKNAGHDADCSSECINYGECGATSTQHDMDDGSSHTHSDN